MSGMEVAVVAFICFLFPTLIASLGALDPGGKTTGLPLLWIMLGVGFIVLIAVRATLLATGQIA
jgi:hypothetical protein